MLYILEGELLFIETYTRGMEALQGDILKEI